LKTVDPQGSPGSNPGLSASSAITVAIGFGHSRGTTVERHVRTVGAIVAGDEYRIDVVAGHPVDARPVIPERGTATAGDVQTLLAGRLLDTRGAERVALIATVPNRVDHRCCHQSSRTDDHSGSSESGMSSAAAAASSKAEGPAVATAATSEEAGLTVGAAARSAGTQRSAQRYWPDDV